jgi:hypothetical protein
MAQSMLIWTGAVTLACAGSALWMRMQPVYEPGQKPKFSILGLLVGQTLRPGIRLARGKPALSIAMSWVFWMLLGFLAVALWNLYQAHADWRFMHVVYGVLCGIGFAIVGAIAGFFIGMAIAIATKMSSFEGKSGYFCVAIGFIGAVLGFIGGSIGMTIYFATRTAGAGG